MDFGRIPFPDDLYLSDEGRIALGAFPSEALAPFPEYQESMRGSLAQLDGFSPTAPVFFGFDGSLDPTTLPTQSDSTSETASVFLLDVDPGSPTAFQRTPVIAVFDPAEQRLALRPADGHPLVASRRYAAVVTNALMDADGNPVRPAEGFAAIRDASARPEGTEGEAYDLYEPVLASLASNGVPRHVVSALAVFRVQSIVDDMAQARTQIWERDAPTVVIDAVLSGDALDAALGTPAEDAPGLDVMGGVQHSNIAYLIHGHYAAPSFISATARTHGPFERDEEGALRIKREEDVPFTLLLPSGEGPFDVVLYQHGITTERSVALAAADTLAENGYAVIAPDAPFHGNRGNRLPTDRRNRFTGEEEPDGFGDGRGTDIIVDFAGLQDTAGELTDFSPVYFRDAIRQSATDLMVCVRVIRDGDFSGVTAFVEDLEVPLSDAPVSFIGYSLGGIIGTSFTAMEPEVGRAVLGVSGGLLTHLVAQSPSFNAAYLPQLLPLLGRDPDAIDYQALHPSFYPEIALWQTLLDRGDSVNFGNVMKSRDVDLLMMMARNDETVPNVSTEGLANAIGVTSTSETTYVELPRAELPIVDNVDVMGSPVTRALVVYENATHGLMEYRGGTRRYEAPVEPPFVSADPAPVANPIDAALSQTLHFFASGEARAFE